MRKSRTGAGFSLFTRNKNQSLNRKLASPALEPQARGDLESARAPGAEDLVDSISRLTKGGLVQYRVIICEVRDIEHVEALHREIGRNSLANRDGFRHAEIRGGVRCGGRWRR